MPRIEAVPDIDEKGAAILGEMGISSTERLLTVAAHKNGRLGLAEDSGIEEKDLLQWAKLADLMRVRGVGTEYADLLYRSGVFSLNDLAKRRPDRLYEQLIEINHKEGVVRRLPSRDQVRDWIDEAKKTTTLVTY